MELAEKHLLKQPVGRDDLSLPPGVEPVELQLVGDSGHGLVTVSTGPSTKYQHSLCWETYTH